MRPSGQHNRQSGTGNLYNGHRKVSKPSACVLIWAGGELRLEIACGVLGHASFHMAMRSMLCC